MDRELLLNLAQKAGIKFMGDKWVLTTWEHIEVLLELARELPSCPRCNSTALWKSYIVSKPDANFTGCLDCEHVWSD